MEKLDDIAFGVTLCLGVTMPALLYYSHKTKSSAKKMYNITKDIKDNFREYLIN